MKGGWNRFDKVFKKFINEELDPIMKKFFRWNKGEVAVYAHMITDEDLYLCNKFITKCRENNNLSAKPGKYLVYNPNIPEGEGQVWMNNLAGYKKASEGDSKFGKSTIEEDGLTFEEWHYTPKSGDLEEGVDTWIGIQIPAGKQLVIPDGMGNNGSDGSTAYSTDWLPIVNGKFDRARSVVSMKQSNFTNEGQAIPEIDEACLEELKKLFEQ